MKDTSQTELNIRRQKNDIAKYYKAGGKLDLAKAWRLFGCSKISTRTGELEREGKIPKVKRGWRKVQTKYGETTIRTYFLPKLSLK